MCNTVNERFKREMTKKKSKNFCCQYSYKVDKRKDSKLWVLIRQTVCESLVKIQQLRYEYLLIRIMYLCVEIHNKKMQHYLGTSNSLVSHLLPTCQKKKKNNSKYKKFLNYDIFSKSFRPPHKLV